MSLKVFADIVKVDEDQRMVYGYASTTSLDSQGDIITREALSKALPDYMRFANIREMHQNSAVGVAESASVNDKGVYICAKIVDEKAWQKVKSGVYKGYSIGGRSLLKNDNIINELSITEISLVDRPANAECVFEMYKAEGMEKIDARTDVNPKEGVDKYGDVTFADEKNKKYPLDTSGHVRAAWNYINKGKNAAKYNSSDLATIKGKIIAAWKSKIDPKGPPSAAADTAKAESAEMQKGTIVSTSEDGAMQCTPEGLTFVAQFAGIMDQLGKLQEAAEIEAAAEGDGSTIPDQLSAAIRQLGDILEASAKEETDELVGDDDNATDDDSTSEGDSNDEQKSEGHKDIAKAQEESEPNSEGEKDKGDENKEIVKAGARNSKDDANRIQGMHDAAVALGASCATADDGDTDKSAKVSDVQKADIVTKSDDLQKLDAMAKELDELKGKNTELEKALSEIAAMPRERKAAVMNAISKSEDSNRLGREEVDLSNSNDPKEMIKKVHQNPVPLHSYLAK